MPEEELSERLRAVTELLESLARDRTPLDALDEAERARLLNAAGDLFHPNDRGYRVWASAFIPAVLSRLHATVD